MIFKSIEIQNFMAIRTATIELDKQGLVLIKGDNQDNPNFQSNGAGKSTIVESLVYALFGRTIRGIRGDDVVNRVANANCKVVLDIVDDDGSAYRIARYRKHKQNKNSVFLFCNGTDITPKSEADFTKKVIELLQTDFMTFTSSILYSAESFKFTQATDAELKSAFEVMLDLKVYSDCQEEVKNQLRELSSNKQDLLSKISMLDHKKSVFEESKSESVRLSEVYESTKSEKIEAIAEKIEELEDQKAGVKDELQEILDKKESVKKLIEGLKTKKSKSSEVEEAIKTLNTSIDEDEDEKAEIKSKLRKINNLIRQNTDEMEDRSKSITKSEKRIKDANATLVELEETVGTPCPTCGKPLDKDHIKDAVAECNTIIESETQNIDICTLDYKELQKIIDKYSKDVENLESDLDDVESELEEYRTLLEKVKKRQRQEQEVDSEILAKEKELIRIEKQYNDKKVLEDSFDSKIKLYENQVEELSEEQNPYIKQIEEYDDKIRQLNPKYEELNSEMDVLSSDEDILNFWLQGYSNSGIKSMLLDDITPFLNERTNKYLKALAGDHISVNFTTQTKLKSGEMREKFQIELINSDGGDSYMSNSSGEKRRIDVAINLALQDLIASRANKKINFVVLDEVMDSLDNAGVEDVLKLLQEISNNKSSVFVISHNENIQTAFENFLVVTKNGGYSTVVKE